MNIAVIGLGLIGGSVLRALAARGHRGWGYDADPTTRAMARTAAARAPAAARWQVTGSIVDAANGAGLVVLAVPLTAVRPVLDELAGVGFTGLVTDVVSVKRPVLDLVADRLRGGHERLANYVGGHPMAGREVAGFAAADPELFTDAAWALCLEPETLLGDWLDVATLVTALGARVVPTTADEHDASVAAISQLPHLVASAVAAGAVGDPLALTLGAGSFRDVTRVAAGPTSLAAAMCGGNPSVTAAALDRLIDALTDARDALDATDPIAAMRAWLEPGHEARVGWPPGAGSTIELPARADTLLRLGRVGGWVTAIQPDRTSVTAVRP